MKLLKKLLDIVVGFLKFIVITVYACVSVMLLTLATMPILGKAYEILLQK